MTDVLTVHRPLVKDPWYQICLRAERDKRFERVRDEIIDGRRAMDEGRMVYNMDGGPFFHDTRAQSIITAPATAITLATTDLLVAPGSCFAVPTGYFISGKKVRLTIWGTITTALTPGNGVFNLYVGTSSAGGVKVASGTAEALVASQSNIPFLITAYLKCNGGAVETAKPVEAYATWMCGTALVTAANQQAGNPIPLSAPAATNIDNTVSTLGFNIQFNRSGSTAETLTTRDITFESLS